MLPTDFNGNQGSHIVDTYDYTDEYGTLLSQVVRSYPKAFSQRRPDGKGGWIPNLQGVRRVPYKLPELLASDQNQPVFVVEGEKDTDTLVALGLVATTNLMGAKKWRDEYSPYLKGRNVVILPHNDSAGYQHGQIVAKSLSSVANSVKVLDLPGLPEGGGDVTDWLNQGHTGDELVELATSAPEWGAENDANRQHWESTEPFSLKSLTDRDEPGPLSYVWGDLIPTGFPSNWYGDGGASKSTTAMGLAVSITQGKPFLGLPTGQGPVLYLDWELNEEAFLRRLYPICRGMGLLGPPADLLYSSLIEPLSHHLHDVIQACNQVQPVLVIIDSLGPASAADPNDTKAMIGIIQASRQLRTACLMVDHQSKTPTQSYSSKSAYGSAYKAYLVRGGMQLELTSSVSGRASVILRHTKNSFTFKHGPIAYHISYDDDAIRFQLGAVTDVEFSDVEALSAHLKVLDYLEGTGGGTKNQIVEGCGLKGHTIDNALSKLRGLGKLPEKAPRLPSNERWYELI